MQLEVWHAEGHVMAATAGPIDDSTGDDFRAQLHPLVGRRGTRLVIDLSGSPRINSEGIASLVRLVSDANTNGSRVVFAAPSTFVRNVISTTRLDKFFDLADTRADAVRLVMA